jgi:hypothetical protein
LVVTVNGIDELLTYTIGGSHKVFFHYFEEMANPTREEGKL